MRIQRDEKTFEWYVVEGDQIVAIVVCLDAGTIKEPEPSIIGLIRAAIATEAEVKP